MSFKFVRQLPSPDQVKEQTPMSEEMKKIKEQRDRLIQDVITGDSDKFLVIVGPCSADNEDSVCEYTNRLAKVQEKVADRLVLVPRIYTNKPRTTGEGYKGMLHQPDPEAQPDVMAGILAIRHMHMRSMEETGLTSREGVYAGGDAVTGAATVILAMGAGKKAAESMDKYLKAKHGK